MSDEVTDIQSRQLPRLRKDEERAHKRKVQARVARLRAEADHLEEPSKARHRALDVAAEEERSTERAFRAAVRDRQAFEAGEAEAA